VQIDGLPDALARLNTCVLADAVDRLGLQLKNRGYAQPGLRSLGGGPPVVVGYAVTAKIRSSDPPILGQTYYRHTGWWNEIARLPGPRIVVIEDIDKAPGRGACAGELAAASFRALGCVGVVTNGAGRDIPSLSQMDFPLFAAHVSPSRAYAHLVEHTCEIEIFGLTVRPGDLLVADQHGLLSIPVSIAERACQVAGEILARKKAFVGYCASDSFTVEGMEEQLRQI
jgi:4-hydroxy-4-methyl-2-oxoglutarate aldolase